MPSFSPLRTPVVALRRLAGGLALALGLLPPLAAQFTERAQPAGLDLAYPTSPGGHTAPGIDGYAVGNAAAACDLDGDGWTDLIVARAGAPCLVFINNRDGTYREEAKARGLDTVSDIGGIAVGDLQNRGVPDIVMVPISRTSGSSFSSTTAPASSPRPPVERGVASPVTRRSAAGQSISLVDYDRDGFLDIHVSEWSVSQHRRKRPPRRPPPQPRQSRSPAFSRTEPLPPGLVQPVTKNVIAGYATAWADFDGDGYPDVFLAGDFGTSQLWWNNGDGTFTNSSDAAGIANPADGMGIAVLDYDGDGKLDLFVSAISLTNPSSTTDKGYFSDNKLFRYAGNRRFSELALGAGVRNSGWGWASACSTPTTTAGPISPSPTATSAPAPTSPPAGPIPRGSLSTTATGTFTDRRARSRHHRHGSWPQRRRARLRQRWPGGPVHHADRQPPSPLPQRHPGQPHQSLAQPPLRRHRIQPRRLWLRRSPSPPAAARRSRSTIPTNAYIGQREPRLHFGLGTATTVEKVSVKWPNGAVQDLLNVAADRTVTVTEIPVGGVPPTISTQPQNAAAAKDAALTLTVAGTGSPAPVYLWFKDGVIVPGQNGPTLTFERLQPVDAGTYTVSLTNPYGTITSIAATVTVTADLSTKSVARWWNEALLDGIRKDTPNPPVHARNLFHLSAALWDAFWAYERDGWAAHHEVFHRETIANLPADEPTRLAAQREAMSTAAYTVIRQRFARSPGADATLAGIRWLMQRYGFPANPDPNANTGTSPAAVGLRIGQKILELNLTDGANESGNYANATGYTTTNPALVVRYSGVGTAVDPNRWQPLDLLNTVTQNGIVLGASVQPFVGANAKTTRTFALGRAANGFLIDDPGAPPRLNAATRADYIAASRRGPHLLLAAHRRRRHQTRYFPGSLLNNPLGTNAGTGHPVNPVTGRAYAPNVVNRGDYARVLAEFWADGPSSETPPGHWNLVFNQISDHPLATHRFLGNGTPLRRLEWDVTGYLALNGAMHDAARRAWTLKWQYHSARPITMIRYLAGKGQSSDPALPSYHVDGLPLIPGQIELITAASAAPGQRHRFLSRFIGQIAVKALLGNPPSATQTSGVGWVLGEDWVPYQRETFVTPAFPAYTSGHSTFSRAGAEVLTRFTGSEFPGGLASYNFAAGRGLGFEAGPAADVQLQWATYYDAADQAGLSRLYGGIHIAADDFVGRRLGSKVGLNAFDRFLTLYSSSSLATLPTAGTSTIAAPAIVSAPAAVSSYAGRTAQFAVEVAGPGPMTYQWLRGQHHRRDQSHAGVIQPLRRRRRFRPRRRPQRPRSHHQLRGRSYPRRLAGPHQPLHPRHRRPRRAHAHRRLRRPRPRRQIRPRARHRPWLDHARRARRVARSGPRPRRQHQPHARAKHALGRRRHPASLFASLGAFPLAAGSADSALQATLAPGSYTAVLTDTAGRSGNALVEIYEADATTTRVVNLSARAYVGPGADIGIAGFAVRGGNQAATSFAASAPPSPRLASPARSPRPCSRSPPPRAHPSPPTPVGPPPPTQPRSPRPPRKSARSRWARPPPMPPSS